MSIQRAINSVIGQVATVKAIQNRNEQQAVQTQEREAAESKRAEAQAAQAQQAAEREAATQKRHEEQMAIEKQKLELAQQRQSTAQEKTEVQKQKVELRKMKKEGLPPTPHKKIPMVKRGNQAAQEAIDEKVAVQQNFQNRFPEKKNNPFTQGGKK